MSLFFLVPLQPFHHEAPYLLVFQKYVRTLLCTDHLQSIGGAML